MFDINKLPSNGYILAYSDGKILFDSYKLDNNCVILGSGGKFDDEKFYEIHCFNESQEYRKFMTHEILLSEHDESEQENFDRFIYRDEQILQEKYSRLLGYKDAKIIVINRFAYTEDDSIYLAGYRLGGIIHD